MVQSTVSVTWILDYYFNFRSLLLDTYCKSIKINSSIIARYRLHRTNIILYYLVQRSNSQKITILIKFLAIVY